MRIFFMNFEECPNCVGCAHYKPLTTQREHSPRFCSYALDTGHIRGGTVQSCTKKITVATVTA